MRQIFGQFKRPYLIGPTEKTQYTKDTDPKIQNLNVLETGEQEIQNLYKIVNEVIINKGIIPQTTDINKRAVMNVFEKAGIFPALRNNVLLEEPLKYYAYIDLHMFPFTLYEKHADELANNTDINMNKLNNKITPNRTNNGMNN